MRATQIAVYFKDRKGLIKGFRRNEYIVASEKDGFFTPKFMLGVISGKYWWPKLKEQHHKVCAEPPQKKLILEAVCGAAKSKQDLYPKQPFRNTIVHLIVVGATVPLLLSLLDVLNPGHEFFRKDYKPPSLYGDLLAEPQIEDSTGFFAGMPTGNGRTGRLQFHLRDKQQTRLIKREILARRKSALLQRIEAWDIKAAQ